MSNRVANLNALFAWKGWRREKSRQQSSVAIGRMLHGDIRTAPLVLQDTYNKRKVVVMSNENASAPAPAALLAEVAREVCPAVALCVFIAQHPGTATSACRDKTTGLYCETMNVHMLPHVMAMMMMCAVTRVGEREGVVGPKIQTPAMLHDDALSVMFSLVPGDVLKIRQSNGCARVRAVGVK